MQKAYEMIQKKADRNETSIFSSKEKQRKSKIEKAAELALKQ